jgi:hypothetical protein
MERASVHRQMLRPNDCVWPPNTWPQYLPWPCSRPPSFPLFSSLHRKVAVCSLRNVNRSRGRSWFPNPTGKEIFSRPKRSHLLWGLPSLLFIVYRVYFPCLQCLSIELTTGLRLVLMLRMSGAILHLPYVLSCREQGKICIYLICERVLLKLHWLCSAR